MIYRFDAYSLDTETLELKSAANTITAQPQVFLLLQYLIENRERVVSRDDIIEAVWNGRIISDSALTYAVKEARRLVGDDGRAQGVIRTLPRRGFRFIADVIEEPVSARQLSPPAGLTVPSDKPSIAVLPFENMSDDPQQEYFSDGMAEDLITDISKISGLFVIARNSSFAFKGQALDVAEIAGKLGVKHILEGSVRKMGDKLRVNVQLIDTTSGGHIWAERYDGDLADIFGFQDDIREQIVSALRVSLTPTDRAATERKQTDSVPAYDLFLKGRAHFHIFTPKHFYEAIKCLEEAIEIDPNFADAHTYLAHCNFVGWVHMRPGFDDGLNRSNELAEKSVALDGSSALALVTLSFDQTILLRHDPAIANLEKAITLAANNAEIYALSGQVLNYLGNPERGLEMLEKAFSLEMFAPPLWEFYAGVSRLLLRQYDEALDSFNRGIERAPKFTPAYPHLAWAYVELGRLDDAHDAIKTVLELAPQLTVKKAAKRWHYRVEEHSKRMRDSLRKAGLPEG